MPATHDYALDLASVLVDEGGAHRFVSDWPADRTPSLVMKVSAVDVESANDLVQRCERFGKILRGE